MARPQYIYLIQLREFVNSGEQVYKLGKTTQDKGKRFNGYPPDSKLIIQVLCSNCHKMETELMKIFKTKYKQRKGGEDHLGNEYFEGSPIDMRNTIYET